MLNKIFKYFKINNLKKKYYTQKKLLLEAINSNKMDSINLDLLDETMRDLGWYYLEVIVSKRIHLEIKKICDLIDSSISKKEEEKLRNILLEHLNDLEQIINEIKSEIDFLNDIKSRYFMKAKEVDFDGHFLENYDENKKRLEEIKRKYFNDTFFA